MLLQKYHFACDNFVARYKSIQINTTCGVAAIPVDAMLSSLKVFVDEHGNSLTVGQGFKCHPRYQIIKASIFAGLFLLFYIFTKI
jgi:hypothetical protein